MRPPVRDPDPATTLAPVITRPVGAPRRPRSARASVPPRWALVSDGAAGGSRSAVATVRALAAAGYQPVVAVSGRPAGAAYSRYCAAVIDVPRPESPQDYRAAVEREVDRRPHVAVLPTSDAALVALGLPGAELVDKSVLPRRAAAAGLAVPETTTFADPAQLLAAAGDFVYPIVVKATVKSSPAAVTRRVDSLHALTDLATSMEGSVVVQPFHDSPMRAISGVIHQGELLAVVEQSYLRIWPPGCGTASAAVTVDPDPDLEARLPALLAGHDGVFQVQLVGDLIIDVNPRAYGSLPLAVAAGANLPGIACAATEGRVEGIVRGRPGVRYRWLEGDVRSVLHQVGHGELVLPDALRALRPGRGTAHSVESLTDPGPLAHRVAALATRLWR